MNCDNNKYVIYILILIVNYCEQSLIIYTYQLYYIKTHILYGLNRTSNNYAAKETKYCSTKLAYNIYRQVLHVIPTK